MPSEELIKAKKEMEDALKDCSSEMEKFVNEHCRFNNIKGNEPLTKYRNKKAMTPVINNLYKKMEKLTESEKTAENNEQAFITKANEIKGEANQVRECLTPITMKTVYNVAREKQNKIANVSEMVQKNPTDKKSIPGIHMLEPTFEKNFQNKREQICKQAINVVNSSSYEEVVDAASKVSKAYEEAMEVITGNKAAAEKAADYSTKEKVGYTAGIFLFGAAVIGGLVALALYVLTAAIALPLTIFSLVVAGVAALGAAIVTGKSIKDIWTGEQAKQEQSQRNLEQEVKEQNKPQQPCSYGSYVTPRPEGQQEAQRAKPQQLSRGILAGGKDIDGSPDPSDPPEPARRRRRNSL